MKSSCRRHDELHICFLMLHHISSDSFRIIYLLVSASSCFSSVSVTAGRFNTAELSAWGDPELWPAEDQQPQWRDVSVFILWNCVDWVIGGLNKPDYYYCVFQWGAESSSHRKSPGSGGSETREGTANPGARQQPQRQQRAAERTLTVWFNRWYISLHPDVCLTEVFSVLVIEPNSFFMFYEC